MKTNKELISMVAVEFCCSKAEAKRAIERLRTRIIAELRDCGVFTFPMIGTLYTAITEAHTQYSPISKGIVNIPKRAGVRFKTAKRLKDELNSSLADNTKKDQN